MRSGQICRRSQYETRTRGATCRCAVHFALVLALGIPAFAQSPVRNEIPFENSGTFGLVLVKVEVNGRPAILIVDTGSNQTVISSELADIPPSVWNNPVFSKKGSGFTGSGVYAKVTAGVGTITWRDHQVVTMNMRELSKSLGQKIDGILGMDFLSAFDLVVVDLKNHKLILQP